MTPRLPCPGCARPLVAQASREAGICTGCRAEADNTAPVESGVLVHADDCPGPAVVRHETPRRHVIACRACGASVTVPRRNEWRDR